MNTAHHTNKLAEVLQQWDFIGEYFWSVGPVPFDTSCFYPPNYRDGKSADLSASGAAALHNPCYVPIWWTSLFISILKQIISEKLRQYIVLQQPFLLWMLSTNINIM